LSKYSLLCTLMSGPFWSLYGTLKQEIQFLEFIGGSNLLQAFPNYLICLHSIRISTVAQSTVFKMVVAHPFLINSWSELHMVSCSLNPSTGQSASLVWHTLAHKARQEGVITPITTILRTVIGTQPCTQWIQVWFTILLHTFMCQSGFLLTLSQSFGQWLEVVTLVAALSMVHSYWSDYTLANTSRPSLVERAGQVRETKTSLQVCEPNGANQICTSTSIF